MRYFLLICAVVACASTPVEIADPILEKAIRSELDHRIKIGEPPTGKLTKRDLERVMVLSLNVKKLTEVPKGLEKLTQLTHLALSSISGNGRNPDLPYAQIYELQKALPKCKIESNPKK